MRSNKDKALDQLVVHLEEAFQIEKLFDPNAKKNTAVMDARQTFIYVAIELEFKESYTQMLTFLKENFGMTYSLRAVAYSASVFADKIADSKSLSSKYEAAKQFIGSVYVKAR